MNKPTEKSYRSAIPPGELDELFRLIIDGSHNGILIIDENYQIIFSNQRTTQILGYGLNEIVGQDFRKFLAPDEADRISEYYIRRQKGEPVPTHYQFRVVNKSGKIRELEMSAQLFSGAGGERRTVAQILDVTEQKVAEEKLHRANRLYTILSQINQLIVREKDRGRLFEGICQIFVEFGGFPLVWIGLINPETQMVKVSGKAGQAVPYLDTLRISLTDPRLNKGPTARAILKKKPVAFDNLSENPQYAPWRDEAAKWQLRSSAALPIRVGQAVIGALNIYAAEPDFFDAEEMKLLEETASDISFALEKMAEEDARLKATEQLRLSEERYHAVSDLTSDFAFAFRLEPDGQLVHEWSTGAMERITGYASEELKKKGGWEAIAHAEDRHFLQEQLDDVLAGKSRVVEYRIMTKDGKTRWVRDYARPVTDTKSGRVTKIIGAVQDITERKTAEEALRKTREHLETVLATSPAITYIVRVDGDQFFPEFITQNLKALLGYVPREYVEDPHWWLAHIHPEDRPTALANQQVLLQKGHLVHEYRFLHADGKYRWIRDEVKTVTDQDGKPVELIGSLIDITGRKTMEEEMRMLAHALRSVREYITVTDMDNRIIFANDAFLNGYGYSMDEVLGKRIDFVRSSQNPPEVYTDIHQATLQGGWQGELLNRRKNGEEFPIFLSTSLVYDEKKRPIAMIGVSRDISELKRLQDQVQQAQKMEAIGRLAGGIAHDFNNLLTVINGYCDLMLMKGDIPENIFTGITQIKSAGEKAAQLTSQLLAFSRKQIIQFQTIRLHSFIRETEEILRRLIGEDIRLEIALSDGNDAIEGDPGQIQQILINLAVNARDAMPRGGTIRIETTQFTVSRENSRKFPEFAEGHYLVLTVQDTGVGMDEKMMSHIFEPFYTTKNASKGTGLGLSTVYGIVKQCNSHIRVESKPGRGTTFRIYFPVSGQEREEKGPSTGKSLPLPGGTESILLVEDDDPVREFTRQVLENAGYRVIVARDGAEALKRMEAHGGEIQLLLTDIIMPGISGRQLADQLIKRYPTLKICYMSGYTDNELSQHGVLAQDIEFVQKPFSPETITIKIRQILNGAAKS